MEKYIKIQALQELFDKIIGSELPEIKKIENSAEQTGFLKGLLFAKQLIIKKEVELMESSK